MVLARLGQRDTGQQRLGRVSGRRRHGGHGRERHRGLADYEDIALFVIVVFYVYM